MQDEGGTHDELRARNAELEAIFRALPDLLFALDPRGVIVGYRAGRAQDLYAPPSEFLGKRMVDVLPPPVAAELGAALARVAAGETLVRVEYELPIGGASKWFEARIVPTDGGNTIVIARDVTEQRTAQEERRRLDRKVEEAQRLESLGVLAGGVAHDFNNLLAAILGAADLLARHAPEGSPGHVPLEVVRESAWRASELSRQLLAYAGKSPLSMQHVDVGGLVLDTAKLLESAISKRARLELDLAEGVPAVFADVAQIRQVVMNLITNASDALEGCAGTITLRARGAERAPGGEVEGAGAWVEIAIEDDGAGMDEATRARMFDPFFTTKGMGRGLGLAAVTGIVRAHAGHIDVESAPGRGTRVRLLLPASDQPAEPLERAGPAVIAPLGPGVALVVDDEPAVALVAARILGEAGLEVVVAHDGAEAVELFRQRGDVDVCLVDLTMPRLGGHDTLAELRRLDPGVPVILMSGYDAREADRGVSRSDAAGPPPEFLPKPFRTTALLAAIRRALEIRRGRAT